VEPTECLFFFAIPPMASINLDYLRLWNTLLFLVLLLVWIWRSLDGFNTKPAPGGGRAVSFNWHPLLMTIAFLLFMGEGVFAFRLPSGAKVEPGNQSRLLRKKYHMTLNLLALLIAGAGTIMILVNHTQLKYGHLQTAHSWVGITVLALALSQWVVGFAVFWLGKGDSSLKRLLLPWHQLAGKFITFLAVATMALGFFEFQKFQSDPWGIKAVGAAVAVLLLVQTAALLAHGFASPLHPTDGPLLAEADS